MTDTPERDEFQADARADRTAYLVIAGFTLLSWILLSTSDVMEAAQAGDDINPVQPWLIQFASHLATLLLLPVAAWIVSHVRFERGDRLKSIGVILGGTLVFGVGHVLLMVLIRSTLWPIFLDGQYVFGLSNPMNWVYELRKDAYTFFLHLGTFAVFRQLEQQRLEIATRREDAVEHKRLSLKSGGRTLLISVDDIVWAKAAANYVEIYTKSSSHLVRLSLSELARLLSTANAPHIRTHRSYLVNQAEIQEIIPDGNGGAEVKSRSGFKVPVGRSYRKTVERALQSMT